MDIYIYFSLLLLFILICSSLSVTVPYNTVHSVIRYISQLFYIKWYSTMRCIREIRTKRSSFIYRKHFIPNPMPVDNRIIRKTKYDTKEWATLYDVWEFLGLEPHTHNVFYICSAFVHNECHKINDLHALPY